MCSEFILAFLYFLVLLVINYFLFNNIKKNIFLFIQLVKVEKILQELQEFPAYRKNFLYLLLNFKKQNNFRTILIEFNQNKKVFQNYKDFLIFVSSYEFFGTTLKNKRPISFSFFTLFFFNLLKNQYVSKKLK